MTAEAKSAGSPVERDHSFVRGLANELWLFGTLCAPESARHRALGM